MKNATEALKNVVEDFEMKLNFKYSVCIVPSNDGHIDNDKVLIGFKIKEKIYIKFLPSRLKYLFNIINTYSNNKT